MTPEAYANLLEYIAQNNCWGINMYGITVERLIAGIERYGLLHFDRL